MGGGQRSYRARAEVTYVGGTLPDDAADALTAALSSAAAGVVSVVVSRRLHDIVLVSAEMRGTSPLDAITTLDEALNRALRTTGLFEEVDVTGKTLHVTPADRSW